VKGMVLSGCSVYGGHQTSPIHAPFVQSVIFL
jgi:hypothetical protein